MKNLVYILIAVAAVAAIFLYSQYGGLPGVVPSNEGSELGEPLEPEEFEQEVDGLTEEAFFPENLAPIAEVRLRALGDSREEGSATLSEAEGKAVVTIKLSGAPSGVKQPAHLHIGTCPGLGPILYNLNPLVDGLSQTVLQEPAEKLKSQFPLVINIHKSEAESTVYVSCGELEL